MLLDEVPGVPLRDHPDADGYLPRWQALLRDVAQIQRDVSNQSETLLALGCPDWPLEALKAQIAPLIGSLPSLLKDGPHQVSEEEMASFQQLIPRLEELCERLAGYAVPLSLNHGDLHSGNILATQSTCVLLDWAGFIGRTHPFFCLAVVFEELRDPQIREQALDAYLPTWTVYEPMNRLREAVRLALPLGIFSGMVGHRRQLLFTRTYWERAEEQGNVLYYLRQLREHVRAEGPS